MPKLVLRKHLGSLRPADEQSEDWRECVGFYGYEVSNRGRVRRSVPGHGTYPGKLLKDQYDHHGYPMVHLWIKGKRFGIKIHRLVAEAFLPPRTSPAHFVAHNDGTPLNKHASNLRWATLKENQADRVKHGTDIRGEKQWKARLKNKDIPVAIKMRKGGYTVKAIAEHFGVHRETMGKMFRGESWSWLTGFRPTNG